MKKATASTLTSKTLTSARGLSTESPWTPRGAQILVVHEICMYMKAKYQTTHSGGPVCKRHQIKQNSSTIQATGHHKTWLMWTITC